MGGGNLHRRKRDLRGNQRPRLGAAGDGRTWRAQKGLLRTATAIRALSGALLEPRGQHEPGQVAAAPVLYPLHHPMVPIWRQLVSNCISIRRACNIISLNAMAMETEATRASA